jgi:Doubled CXXCH motif (Paired_CXXCH_1)
MNDLPSTKCNRAPGIRLFIAMLGMTLLRVASVPGQEQQESGLYPVPPPLVYRGIYPCQACHRKDVTEFTGSDEDKEAFLGTYLHAPNPQPRVLVRMHRDNDLRHGKGAFWCLNCHNTQERNYLKLLNGEVIPFDESYRLCGECHGSIYRDWKLGIHGRRVGQWDGTKLYLLCAHCHDPHNPKFRKIPGLPTPRSPSFGRWEEDGSGQGRP